MSAPTKCGVTQGSSRLSDTHREIGTIRKVRELAGQTRIHTKMRGAAPSGLAPGTAGLAGRDHGVHRQKNSVDAVVCLGVNCRADSRETFTVELQKRVTSLSEMDVPVSVLAGMLCHSNASACGVARDLVGPQYGSHFEERVSALPRILAALRQSEIREKDVCGS